MTMAAAKRSSYVLKKRGGADRQVSLYRIKRT